MQLVAIYPPRLCPPLTSTTNTSRRLQVLSNLFDLGIFDGAAGGAAYDFGWEAVDRWLLTMHGARSTSTQQ